MTEEIELGDLVKDAVTGFEGIAVSKHIFMTGCTRWGVQPLPEPAKKGGKITYKVDATAFDEPQLIILKKAQVKLPSREKTPEEPTHRKHGGPVALFPEKQIERR